MSRLRIQLPLILVLLIVLDVATFGFAVAVKNRQDDTLNVLHAGICRNSRILELGLRKDIAQTSNTTLYKQFFPQIPPAQLKVVIARQVQQDRAQIARLAKGC